MRGKPISDEQIELIKADFAASGSLRSAARAAGVSVSTAKKYAGSRDEFEHLRKQRRIALIHELSRGEPVVHLPEAPPAQMGLMNSIAWAQALGGDGNWLYFISDRDRTRVKIGQTRSLVTRMIALQTANPYPLNLEGVVSRTHYSEREVHLLFSTDRLHAEWFEFSEPIQAWLADNGLCVRLPIVHFVAGARRQRNQGRAA